MNIENRQNNYTMNYIQSSHTPLIVNSNEIIEIVVAFTNH